MRSEKNIEKLVGKINVTPDTQMDRKTLNDILMAQEKTKTTSSAKHQPNTWRIIMKSRMTKFAAAAVIIIGVLIGINQFGGSIDGASVAWASLPERVGRIGTCFYKGHSKITGGSRPEKVQEHESEFYLSSEYGFRSDTYTNGNVSMMQYAILEEKVIINVRPAQKEYIRMSLTHETLQEMQLEGNDPREMVRQIMLGEYTHLGKSVIDGVKVEGIETTDPRAGGGQFEKYLARCWVDVETQLPVLLEREVEMFVGANMPPMKISMVLDSFEWDIDLDPEIFKPDIPSDYKLLAEMQLPGQDEGNAVNGLRIFAEITGGKYPQKLSVMNIGKEFVTAVRTKLEKEWQSKVDSDPAFKPTEDEIRDQTVEKVLAVQGACMFYAGLVKADKDVAYYGDKVTSDDVDAVLMRWKISESEYRVIYGDLTLENVTAERLAELEEGI